MSEEHETEGEELPVVHFLGPAELVEEGALRWTPTTVLIDAANTAGAVLEGLAGFFRDQARSLAARASLRELLEDRELRHKLRSQDRFRMRMQTMEDIDDLPETPEKG